MKFLKIFIITIIVFILIVFAFSYFSPTLNFYFSPPYENAPYRGGENAPVTIIEFGSYGCGATAIAENTMGELLKNYGEKLKLIYLDFPKSDFFWKASEAAQCASEQGKFWEYHELLFERQEEWQASIERLEDYAVELDLNPTEFNDCLNEERYKQKIEETISYGKFRGVDTLPTFFINNVKMERAQSFETFSKAIDFFLE